MVSHLLSPAGVAAIALLLLSSERPEQGWLLLSMLLYVAIPVGVLLYLLRRQRLQTDPADVYDPGHARRQSLLSLGVVTYAVCLGILIGLEAPDVYRWAGSTFFSGAAAVWAINRVWKISIHATGAGGAAALVALAQVPGWPLALGVPLVVAWARWQRRAHSPAQLVAGTLMGGLMAWGCGEMVL